MTAPEETLKGCEDDVSLFTGDPGEEFDLLTPCARSCWMCNVCSRISNKKLR